MRGGGGEGEGRGGRVGGTSCTGSSPVLVHYCSAQHLQHVVHTITSSSRNLKHMTLSDVIVCSKAIQHVRGDLSLMVSQVALHPHQGIDNLRVVDVVLGLRIPLCESCEGELTVQTANHEDQVGPAVVPRRQRLEPFSTCCVHSCKLRGMQCCCTSVSQAKPGGGGGGGGGSGV